MKIPKTIKVGAHKYKVAVVPMTDDALHDSSGTTISINNDIKSESVVAEALLHEILHAIESLLGEDLPERTIQSLASWLLDNISSDDVPAREWDEARWVKTVRDANRRLRLRLGARAAGFGYWLYRVTQDNAGGVWCEDG
jgi:hypothetical protein